MNIPGLDDAMTADIPNTPKGQAELALLKLIQTYPDAAKYLGPGALPTLQQIARDSFSSSTTDRANSVMKGIQNAQ